MRRSLFSSLLGVVFCACATAAYAASFSDLLPGARPMGMGMAYTAVAEGPDAIFYNPAGTAQGDFPILGGSFGRAATSVGMLSLQSFSYARPLPVLPGATVGAGFFGVHQGGEGGDKNEFLLHFSDALRLPQFYLTYPLKVGGNVKFEHIAKDARSNHKLVLGLDAGVMAEAVKGLTVGMSVLDLTPDAGVEQPSLNMGTAYRWRGRYLFSGDLRVRRNLTQFFPGVEVGFFQNLLKVRAGKGMAVDSRGLVSLGAGVNFSPVFLDFAMTVPFQRIHSQSGGAQVSLQYRFGAPNFYGLYPGGAAQRSEDLKSQLEELDKRKQDLEAQVTAASADKTSLDTQLEAEESRLRELRAQLRQAEIELEKRNYEAGHPKPPLVEPAPARPAGAPEAAERPEGSAPARPARAPKGGRAKPGAAAPLDPSRFPAAHVVQAGDTLRKLAEKYYGDPAQWERIYEANPDKIERGLPVEGTTLTIPKPGKR